MIGSAPGRAALSDPSCLPSRNEELWVIQRPGQPANATPPHPNDDLPGSGSLITSIRDEQSGTDKQVPVPLKHTDVQAQIAGYIASVTVTQQFHNPFSGKIEAVYVFPLPENAAVNDFLMTIGDRKIRGIIREREQAERIYNDARSQGYTASLLTQERPNIFTQKVANIEPGKSIDISIKYFNTLAYVDGSYEFVFPMVVGPRFNPPAPLGAGFDGNALNNGIAAVPRGAASTSGHSTEVQYLRPGERSGHDISLALSIDTGSIPIDEVSCKSHVVQTRRPSSGESGRYDVRLSDNDTIPNKDFVLRYKLGDTGVRSAAIAQSCDAGTFISLMLVPPEELRSLQRAPLEMVFVLDCSGSMNGEPISQAKKAIARALKQLQPTDTFQLIQFSNTASSFGPAPIPASKSNINRAISYLNALNGEGGTMMIEGIKASLDFPHDDSRLRFVCFVTDGYIGNESEILGEVQRRLGPSRVFSFGIGSAVNRYLLDSMANVGRGCVGYWTPGDSAADMMDAFIERISHPAITDLSIDWASLGIQPTDAFPQRTPDLFVGRPIVISAKSTHGSPDNQNIRVTGTIDGKRREFLVPISTNSSFADSGKAVAAIWARHKIADLADNGNLANPNQNTMDAIRQVALQYGLMSQFTAFIAVDSLARTEGSFGTTVAVPVNMPEGVRYETTVPER